ncbi:MAG: hypothetical protein QMD85_03130 [Candidatus Aenigmarchaeota archaeon]|nr:hypothetical protein [Candidatus Aenigmarchaeota archaeon]MDI6722529.1 hypothetical protein [Candidatus Aenigmarchaeota archaeon]
MPFSDLPGDEQKARLELAAKAGNVELTDSDIYIVYLKKIAELSRLRGKTFIAIIPPINPEVMKHINKTIYAKNSDRIRLILQEGRIVLIDYNFRDIGIPPSYYFDAEHFTWNGRKSFAEILAHDTYSIITHGR